MKEKVPRDPPVPLPVYNLNGSDPSDSAELHRLAFEALRKAQTAFRDTFPHGRDFQANLPGEHDAARAVHRIFQMELDKIARYSLRQFHHALDARDLRASRAPNVAQIVEDVPRE